ncbi:MAG: DMT family transporter [Planctomycetota bacterium]|nr:MAG: DMT family transporter [Planctomycetota bacterium]
MLLGSLGISAMATLVHALAGRCDWEVVATVRAGLALIISGALAVHAGAPLVVLRPPVMWMRSLAGTVSLLCTFYALSRLPSSDVLTLTNMFPIWVTLLSWPLAGIAPTKGAWLAVAVGIAGVVLVAQPRFDDGGLFPILVAITASFSTSIAMFGLHKLGHVDPRAIVAHFSATALVVCSSLLVLGPHDTPNRWPQSSQALLILAGVGVCATAGQLFLTKAFAAGPPARVSVVALTQVAFAMIFETIFFGHAFAPESLLGIVLVLAPTAWLLATQRRPNLADLSNEPPAQYD